MENLEKQQPTAMFEVKELPVEKVDEKMAEELQQKLLVSISTGWIPRIMQKCGISNNQYSVNEVQFGSKAYVLLPYFLKWLEKWVNERGETLYQNNKTNISTKQLFLFKIDQVFIKDWKYFFYTSDGQIFTADKSDFDSNWIRAESLDLYWIPRTTEDFYWKIQRNPCIEWHQTKAPWDWFVHFYDKKGIHKFNLPWDNVFQIKPFTVHIMEWWKLHEYITSDRRQKTTFDTPYKDITQMAVDFNSNFLFIVNKTDEWSTLHIVSYYDFINHHKITEIFQIKDVKEICSIWDQQKNWDNWMVCLMSNGSLKYYRNTFDSFLPGFFRSEEEGGRWWKLIYKEDQEVTTISDSRKTELLKALEDWTISVEINDNIVEEADKIDNDIIDKIWNIKISGKGATLKELFDDANDEESITLVWQIFQKIKKDPQIAKVEWITRSINKKILDKKNKIILDSIFSTLGDITEKLWTASDLTTLFSIKNDLREIQKKRKNIQAWIVAEDKELKSLIEITDQKISEYRELHKEELENEIQDNLDKIKDFLDSVENAIDISSVYSTPIYESTEDMINCLDANGQEKFKKKLKEIVQNRWKEIKELSDKSKKEEANIIEQKKQEVVENIAQIKDIIDEVDDIETIEQYKENDSLVQKTRDLLAELPSSEAQTLDLKLEKIFGERIFSLRLRWEETKWVVQNLDTYWVDTLLYYDEDWSEQVDWKIEWKEKSDWKISLVVKLMNWETHEYDKSLYLKEAQKYGWVRIKWKKINLDMDSDEFENYMWLLYEWKEEGQWKKYHDLVKELRKLPSTGKNKEDMPEEKEKIFKKIQNMKAKYGDIIYTEHLIARLVKQQKLNPRSKVPPFDPDYIVLDEEKEILKKLSTRLVDQKQNQQWIEILEWGPWLWKTVMCEFLAWVTNREIVRVQCSKMDPSDMFFSPTLKKWETSREPADWIKLMQKPWTIILFDEIDKLNDQCIERLHSLFDGGRSVYDPQLWKVKVNPDCLFLWTRNLYDRMSNPILSRWRLLRVTYPWVLNEAFKISKYTNNPTLKKMTNDEFKMLYDKYVSRWEPAPTNVRERKLYDLIININHLLNVFTKLRQQYDSDEPFVYEVSYRDARQVFADVFIEFGKSWDFKKAMEDILIPKAEGAVLDPDDKKTQRQMVQLAINSEM